MDMGHLSLLDIHGELGPCCRVVHAPSQVLSTGSSRQQTLRPARASLPGMPLRSTDMLLRPGA